MVLYIIRHGDPDYEHNTITPRGHEEAKALAEWLDVVPLTRLYTSPLGRAKDTASYTAARKQLTPTVLPWAEESMDYMRPFTPNDTCRYQFDTQNGITDYVDYYTEDRSPTLQRLITGSDALLAELGYERRGAHYHVAAPNEEHIALFCHGGFGTALTAHLLGMPPALGFPSMFMTTTGVTVFEFRDGGHGYLRPRLRRFSDISHLHIKGITENNR